MSFKKSFCIIICAFLLAASLPLSAFAAFSGEDKVVIMLDPGHGGRNIGTAAYGVGEKVYTFRLASFLKQYLEESGSFTVYMTRYGDTDLEICERGIIANDYNADALISLHFDGSVYTSQNGVTVYTSIFDQYALTTLGNSIAYAVASSVGMASNGVKRKADTDGYYWNTERQWDIQDPSLGTLSDYYGIPTWAAKFGIPSMIVEHGFMSNPHDRDIICADGNIEKMARAEADTIIAYYTNHTHTYGAMRRDFPSSCVFQGKQSEHCTQCGHRRNIQMLAAAPDNHYWEATQTYPATCGHDGSIVQKCRITDNLIDKGYKKVENHERVEIIPAPTQHSFAVVKEVAATHTKDGYIDYKCTNCSESYREVVYAEGHSYEFITHTEPTCTEGGGNVYRCSICADQYTDFDAAALGHSYVVNEEVLPTCTEGGHRSSQCSVCDYVLVEEFEPNGHDTTQFTVLSASCTEDGVLTGTCPDCKEEINEVYPAPGHTFESTLIRERTCTEDGEENRVCSVCGYADTHILAALRHDYRMIAYMQPTCTEHGAAELVCSRCSKLFTATVRPYEHEWQTESETSAGLFSKETRQLVCADCGETKVEVISFTAVDIGVRVFGAIALVLLAASAALLAVVIVRKRRDADGETTAEDTADADLKDELEIDL